MQKERRIPEDWAETTVIGSRRAGTTTGTDWCAALCRTPAWAAEQIEHAWLGSLEFSEWTWTA